MLLPGGLSGRLRGPKLRVYAGIVCHGGGRESGERPRGSILKQALSEISAPKPSRISGLWRKCLVLSMR